MKKTVLFAAAFVATTVATAQTGEITSNRGENWLSQDGDWGLSIDATPFLSYAGNLFNGTTDNSAPTWGTPSNSLWNPYGVATPQFTIAGKKLIDANTAYRAKLRLGFASVKNDEIVPSTTTPNAFVTNTTKDASNNIVLGFGMEKRVGSTRVVGVYGAEAMIGLAGQKTTYEYGNAIDANNPGPRPTEIKDGSIFALGVMAFAGVEWFCAPKVSLGAEYNWGIAFASQGEGSGTVESWNGTAVESTESNVGGNSSFGIDTGSNGASINLNFYFQ